MDVRHVIKHFSTFKAAPIDIENDILPFLRGSGIRDQIYVWPVDIDSRFLCGKLVHWQPWDHNDDWALDFERPRCVADIYICRSIPNDWQRLIGCKELLHILDPLEYRVSSAEEIETLASRIILPIEAESALGMDTKTLSDTMGLYEALAVLFPWDLRAELLPDYTSGELPRLVLADYVELPWEYASLVMSDVWARIYPIIMRDLSILQSGTFVERL